MDYKTILVHVNDCRTLDARIAFAAQFAIGHGAHLVGIVQTGILRFLYGTPPDGYLGDLTSFFADLREQANRLAAHFDALARQAGLSSLEHRVGDEEPGYALACQAMYADLVIVGQSDPDDQTTAHAGIPEYVALHAPCPVLVLPFARQCSPVFERALVAWNASPESARAVQQALPLLSRAKSVEVVTFEADGSDRESPGGDQVGLLLARHGIKVELRNERPNGDIADALLACADGRRADLLVMGCYGHTRLREILLGGVSRTILRSMTIPTLMAH